MKHPDRGIPFHSHTPLRRTGKGEHIPHAHSGYTADNTSHLQPSANPIRSPRRNRPLGKSYPELTSREKSEANKKKSNSESAKHLAGAGQVTLQLCMFRQSAGRRNPTIGADLSDPVDNLHPLSVRGVGTQAAG